MSRSFKKPITGIGKVVAKEHRKAKKKMTRETRQWLEKQEDVPSGGYYKRFLHDWRWRPDDGRAWSENPKMMRK